MTEEGAGELSEEQLEVLRVLATGGLADSWGSATVSNRSGKNAKTCPGSSPCSSADPRI